MKSLQLMDVPGSIMFIADGTAAAEGRKKARKKKAAAVVADDEVIEVVE